LGAFNTHTGEEILHDELCGLDGFDIVKKYDIKADFTQLKEMVADNSEGFVIRFKNGKRMKIKGLEYIRLHSLMTQFSNVDIWKSLKEGTPIDLENVPDEFDEWVRNTIKELQSKYDKRFKELDDSFWKTINRKEYFYSVEGTKDAHFMLKRLNSYSTEYQRMIWDEIRPDFGKPFWKRDLDI
jgi:RNA ligase